MKFIQPSCTIIALLCLASVAYSQGDKPCAYTIENLLEKLFRIGIKVEAMENRMNEIEARQIAPQSNDTFSIIRTPNVAFRIHLSHNLGKVTSGSIVKFDQVDLNLGNGYNKIEGVFIAPYNGTYIFSMVLGNPTGHTGAFFMKKNGVGIEYAIAGHTRGWNIGGVTTVAELVTGDRVWVEGEGNVSGAYKKERYHTGFSGILVNSY